MNPLARRLLFVAGVVDLVLGAGYAFQQRWALDTWLWPDSRLTFLFLASMLAAIGVAVIWIAVSDEVGSIPGGAINIIVTMAGVGTYLAISASEVDLPGTMYYVAGCGLLVAINVVLLVRTWGAAPRDERPLPRLVRASYLVFSLVLFAVGLALVFGVQDVMPWPLLPETSVVIGWIFLGDALYFLYAVLRPQWGRAKAQLWSFLAYDVVLIGPLVAHYINGVPDDLRKNVVVYLAVLAYSACLAGYYLFIKREPAER